MKNVIIKHLLISNFKGIKNLEITFSRDTLIKGDNATGKSTVFDAITWCLFGKNSQDAKDFNIKNTVFTELNRMDHTVSLLLLVNDQEVSLKRVFKEKWTKRRGSEESEFTGHETLFFWNDVTCQAGEFQKKISEMIPEQLFKQLTNPLYFNTVMSWQSRRDALISMAGNITNERVVNGSKAFSELMTRLNGQKTLDELKREISAKKSNLKKELEAIPIRIDELLKSSPDPQDWHTVELQIVEKRERIQAIDKEMEDLNASFENELSRIREAQNKILEAKRRMSQIETDLRSKAYQEAQSLNSETNRAKNDLSLLRSEIIQKEYQKTQLDKRVHALEEEISELRSKWGIENAKEIHINEDSFNCPSCGRRLEESDVEKSKAEITHKFHEAKQKSLKSISDSGKTKKQEQDELKVTVKNIELQLSTLKDKEQKLLWCETAPVHSPKEIDLSLNNEYQSLKIEAEKTIETPRIDLSTQKEEKTALNEQIEALRDILRGQSQILKNNERIGELKQEEKKYAQELASLEKTEFTIDAFNKAKMNLIESEVNKYFQVVRFKLFNTLINGGEEPCCETVVDGVPYGDLNHAAQLNAGLDCISALSKNFQFSAPVLIDNAESCNSFLETGTQTIRFYVTKDPKLVIINN